MSKYCNLRIVHKNRVCNNTRSVDMQRATCLMHCSTWFVLPFHAPTVTQAILISEFLSLSSDLVLRESSLASCHSFMSRFLFHLKT